MQLSIIIVSYNVKYFLEQCLASVRRALEGLQGEVVVVDNNSADGSVEYLTPLFPEVKFVSLAYNAGFASANNQALQYCNGKYVLFLNPDTMLAEDALQKTLAFMEAQKEAGALGIKMIDGSGHFLPESKRGFPSPLTSLYKQLGLTRLFPHSKHFAKYYLGHLPVDRTAEVEVLAGAFMLVRREVLESAGSFDEQFFMYGEDIDLSYRITKAGWKNYYFADSAIIHFKGESTAKGTLNYVRVFYQAMLLFVKKHFNGNGAFFFRMLLYAGIAIRGMLGALSRLWHLLIESKKHPCSSPLRLTVTGWPNHIPLPEAAIINNQKVSLQFSSIKAPVTERQLLVVGFDLLTSAAIGKMEEAKGVHEFWLHHVQTNSMVMSSDKDGAGIAAAFCKK